MTPGKSVKDRRQDKDRRIRFALRKANDRMFEILDRPAHSPKPKPEEHQRH